MSLDFTPYFETARNLGRRFALHGENESSGRLDLGGNPGISRDNPLERHHRDALSGRAHAPQNNMVRTILAKGLYARHAASPAQPVEPVAVQPSTRPHLVASL